MNEEAEIAQSIAIPELAQSPQANRTSSATANENTDTNTIINNPNAGTVVTRIEDILAQIIGALAAGQELSIPFSARRSTRRAANAQPEQVRFPGRNQQEAVKFARILLILQLSHDALVSGTVLTKRHIFYQHQHLFEKQGQVDDLVDDIAFNLGIGRGDLNIVAASKGALAGPLLIRFHNGSTLNPCSGDLGVAIPTVQSISSIDVQHIKWILVIEKDHPQLPLLGLFDYDPDGVKILRCYRHGSERLSHEADLGIEALRWLGIRSMHLSRGNTNTSLSNYGQPSHASITSIQCRDPITYLNSRERAAAISTLKKTSFHSPNELEGSELRLELQLMMMLGVKAEIEWLDESGDLCSWLEGEIGEALISERI
ncbi:meiotic recombination SPO11 [Fusarium subglutinans]|uniref:DNA topoisomerase (ATP-hydrolyzing) n=1 Tax=Gibberella subglutinans TaxID=42677 RepID=A0A8H5Q4J6_GIBSU|nr:meiotic recombination SPO11 [Fusarium subglutinans]KAF5607371.1 meiotic recombination SPO11 [Fusarium subglutinans]